MLIRRAILDRIAAGEATLAFRRWKTPTVRPGATLRTVLGVVAVDAVEAIDDAELTEETARRAGFASRAELVADLRGGADRTLYRISLRFAGDDPRVALRESTPDASELDGILARLARMDAARGAPWTSDTLALIGNRPGVAAGLLAEALGRDKLAFKSDVRKLKELGLTESLSVGYRLSPRGRAIVANST